MEANQDRHKDASLDRMLREWVVEDPLPLRFEEQVWVQIKRAEFPPKARLWTWLERLLESVLPQPKVAYCYVSLLLAVGIAMGMWEAQKQINRLDASLGSRYLQSVDPFQGARPNQ
jgi:hypothetical protein